MKSSTAPRCKRWLGLPVRGFYNPCGPWGDFFPVNHRVLGALALQSLGGGAGGGEAVRASGFILMKKMGFGNSGDLGNSFLCLPALPWGWGRGGRPAGGQHPGSGCCASRMLPLGPAGKRELGQFRHSLGCSEGLRVLRGAPRDLGGSLRGFSCSEGPGRLQGTWAALRGHE